MDAPRGSRCEECYQLRKKRPPHQGGRGGHKVLGCNFASVAAKTATATEATVRPARVGIN
jgi:hypothetical protein